MKAVGALAIMLAVFGVVFFSLSSGEPLPERPEEVGYFKSDNKMRVMAFVALDGMTQDEAYKVLAGAMHTPGRQTQAVMYRPGVLHPGDRLTLARDYEAAINMIYDPPYNGWTWQVVRSFDGGIYYETK